MATVEIEYCVPCGFLERAEDIQHTLLTNFGAELDRVALVTGDHGVLEVRLNDETVFDKGDDEYDVDGIAREVRSRL